MQRRQILAAFATLPFAGSLPVLAQGASFAEADLAAAGGPLGDIVLGPKEAKVTVYEYASMTCGHCAAFHTRTFPEVKTKYIDSGKIRFVLREFPLDDLAVAAFMLARCAGETSYHAMIDLLFHKQNDWATNDNPIDKLFNVVKQAGYTQEKFEACLKNDKVYQAVLAVRDAGEKKFGVRSTPTFFINGKVERGALSISDFDRIVAPLVGS